MLIMVLGPACLAFPMDGHIGPCLEWDFLRCGGQSRTVSPVDVTTVIASQLTYCVEVAAELLADVEEQTVRSVHQAQRPGRESPSVRTSSTAIIARVTVAHQDRRRFRWTCESGERGR